MKDRLAQEGYVYHTESVSLNAFFKHAEQLGNIMAITEIKLMPNKGKFARADQVPFHNDCRLIRYAGWYCEKQDPLYGAIQLIDAGDIQDCLSKASLNALESIYIKIPNESTQPIISYTPDGRIRLYYIPWQLSYRGEPQQYRALDEFNAYLNTKKPIEVLLEEGQFLLIDDSRMLHGREAISPYSERVLHRVWIQ